MNRLVFHLITSLILTAPAAFCATNIVRVGTYFFNATNITINVGDTVIWTNASFIAHDSTSSSGIWASGNIPPNGKFTRVFSTTGFFPYICQQHIVSHPEQTGTVTVVSAPNLPPSVTVTAPANNAVFTAPATFSFLANASDTDGSVAQVQFFNGASSLGIDTTSPYSNQVVNLAAGSYTLSAVATDNLGGKATNSISITVNNLPTVSITSPANGSILTAPATFGLVADASDAGGTVGQVEFFNGAVSLGIDTTSPYSNSVVNLPAGTYTFSAVATDNLGGKATNSITVTVNSLPTVSITAPANGSVLTAPATFSFLASASDTDGSVIQVQFFNGVSPVGVDTTSPYSNQVVNLAAGSYTLSAVATDNVGARTTNSVAIIVNALPTASINNPTNGARFTAPATITIDAAATDSDGTVTKVEFLRAGTKVGEDTASPFNLTLSNVAAGSYGLTVVATDNRGATNTSALVTVVVTNAPPSAPVLSAPSRVNGTNISFSFLTQTGLLYSVQRVDALPVTNGIWLAVTNVNGNGSNVSIVEPATASKRFYRVAVQ